MGVGVALTGQAVGQGIFPTFEVDELKNLAVMEEGMKS